MDTEEIRRRIKDLIADVAGIAPETIDDRASLIDDLHLDSLALLQLGVDVDYELALGATEEDLSRLRTVQQVIDLAVRCRNSRSQEPAPPDERGGPVNAPAWPSLA